MGLTTRARLSLHRSCLVEKAPRQDDPCPRCFRTACDQPRRCHERTIHPASDGFGSSFGLITPNRPSIKRNDGRHHLTFVPTNRINSLLAKLRLFKRLLSSLRLAELDYSCELCFCRVMRMTAVAAFRHCFRLGGSVMRADGWAESYTVPAMSSRGVCCCADGVSQPSDILFQSAGDGGFVEARRRQEAVVWHWWRRRCQTAQDGRPMLKL